MNKPKAYIEFGPTGHDSVVIKDKNGTLVHLPVTSIKVTLPSYDEVTEATITLEQVHVTAHVAKVTFKTSHFWCRPWKWLSKWWR